MPDELIQLNGESIDRAIEVLRQLPAEVASKRGGPVRRAVRKAALVILREMSLNVAAVTGHLDAEGHPVDSTGQLLRSLSARRTKPPAGVNGEKFIVGPRRRFYRGQGSGSGSWVTTLATAHWLELGTEKQPAEPWSRPVKSVAGQAIEVGARELSNEVEKAAKKLMRQQRVAK